MKKLMFAFSVAAILPSLAAASSLSGDDIKAKLIGHTLDWKSAKYKVSGTTVMNADGTETVTVKGKAAAGKWHIKGNQLCDKVGKNKESCTTISPVNDTTYMFDAYQSTTIVK